MKVILDGDPKAIAALVFAAQERHFVATDGNCDAATEALNRFLKMRKEAFDTIQQREESPPCDS